MREPPFRAHFRFGFILSVYTVSCLNEPFHTLPLCFSLDLKVPSRLVHICNCIEINKTPVRKILRLNGGLDQFRQPSPPSDLDAEDVAMAAELEVPERNVACFEL